MTIMKRIYIILLFLTISNLNFGQQDLITKHYNQFDTKKENTSFKEHTARNNEATQLASYFFLFYKEYVSSQDINSCVFTPSCSIYAMESIKTLGFLEGLANAFDRLSRCNAFSQKFYPVDQETHKLYDPVHPE